jgi:hypothetical protein
MRRLRDKMREDLALRRISEATILTYVGALAFVPGHPRAARGGRQDPGAPRAGKELRQWNTGGCTKACSKALVRCRPA